MFFLNLFLFSFFCFQVNAYNEIGFIYNGATGDQVELNEIVDFIEPGTVLLIGEQHEISAHQRCQILMLNKLKSAQKIVSVGMEFISYNYQIQLDDFRFGKLLEHEFLTAVNWGKTDFSFYRDQILFPVHPATTLALNAPRWLTSKVARHGLDFLSQEEALWLPPRFELGNKQYFERFKEVMMSMGGHLPSPSSLKNYFAAQSIWDDTMAWNAIEYIRRYPEQILVIIVGEFHVQYGGGLPDRLKARGANNVKTISLLESQVIEGSSSCPRADWLWFCRDY